MSSRRVRILPPSPPAQGHPASSIARPWLSPLPEICGCVRVRKRWRGKGLGLSAALFLAIQLSWDFGDDEPSSSPVLGSTGPQCVTKRLNSSTYQYLCACFFFHFQILPIHFHLFIPMYLDSKLNQYVHVSFFNSFLFIYLW